MDADVKKKWLEALRSGRYQQTIGGLHKSDAAGNHTYCCIGVLAEVLGLEPVLSDYPPTHDRPRSYHGYKSSSAHGFIWSGALPARERAMIGLADDDQDRLVAMNDEHGKSFVEIAAYIEENL